MRRSATVDAKPAARFSLVRAPKRDRLFPQPLRLWDVLDVEAHVRAALESTLAARNARLQPDVKEKALQFLITTCWELGGLTTGGEPRFITETRMLVDCGPGLEQKLVTRHTATILRAHHALETFRSRLPWPARVVSYEFASVRPPSAYRPGETISFSTYSRQIISMRVWDWYRSDMGDDRYEGSSRRNELSLEGLIREQEWDGSDAESYLDRGGDSGHVDELHPYAYADPYDDVLTAAL